jgi:methylmalonyl-CoA/ethylmalonyl-CoA epimerase
VTVLKQFDHIGVVVGDLDKATAELSRLFGLEYTERMQIGDAGIQIAFYPLGTGHMELIEFQKPLDDVDPLVTRPGAGVQHVAFQVDNFDEALDELIHRGLKLVRGFPRAGARGKVAFFYPTEALNLMIEICESSDGRNIEHPTSNAE